MTRCFGNIWVVLLIVFISLPLSADTLQDIDRTVAELGDFLVGVIPDVENQNLTILPFLSDEYGKVTLGDRLKSELELYLAAKYRKVRIILHPEGNNTYTVSGELQTYPGRVRVICRITKPDGSLGGGTRVEIPSTPELLALLEPSAIEQPRTFPSPRGDQSTEDGFVGPDMMQDDPFEPDDAQGFEVEVPSFGTQSFGRSITPGDVDRFRFYKAGRGTVVIEAQTNVDLQLLLYREGENIPFEVGGSEGRASLRLETSLEEGYYVVELLAYDFGIQGSYIFSIDLTGRSNDGFEPDNRLAEAKPIFPDTRQDRALLAGDLDWIELSFTIPAFYRVYTTGVQVDTQIALFTDQEREVLADENSGMQNNAFIPLFLGIRRIYARVSGAGSLAGGNYTLAFDRFDPIQIFPGAGIEEYEIDENPLSFQLRIIQSGNYVIRKQVVRGIAGSATVELFSLPSMRPVMGKESLYSLSAGDYLFVVKSEQVQSVRFCISPEDEGDNCLQMIRE
jgi:hypothetical protein